MLKHFLTFRRKYSTFMCHTYTHTICIFVPVVQGCQFWRESCQWCHCPGGSPWRRGGSWWHCSWASWLRPGVLPGQLARSEGWSAQRCLCHWSRLMLCISVWIEKDGCIKWCDIQCKYMYIHVHVLYLKVIIICGCNICDWLKINRIFKCKILQFIHGNSTVGTKFGVLGEIRKNIKV